MIENKTKSDQEILSLIELNALAETMSNEPNVYWFDEVERRLPFNRYTSKAALYALDNLPHICETIIKYGFSEYLSACPESFERLTLLLATYPRSDLVHIGSHIFLDACCRMPVEAEKYFGLYADSINDLEELCWVMTKIKLPNNCLLVESQIQATQQTIDIRHPDFLVDMYLPPKNEVLSENQKDFEKIEKFVSENRNHLNLLREKTWQID